jgi:Spy/CpxP family protein refolding chaperone
MNFRKLFVLSVSSLSLVAPAFADTQVGGVETSVATTNIAEKADGKGKMCGGHHRGFKGGLDLTDAQKLELAKSQRELKDLLTKPSIDRSAIMSAQGKINDLKASISNIMIAFKADFAETLTPEQRQKLRFAPSFGGHRHFRHGGPGHGGPRGPRPTAEAAPAPEGPVS